MQRTPQLQVERRAAEAGGAQLVLDLGQLPQLDFPAGRDERLALVELHVERLVAPVAAGEGGRVELAPGVAVDPALEVAEEVEVGDVLEADDAPEPSRQVPRLVVPAHAPAPLAALRVVDQVAVELAPGPLARPVAELGPKPPEGLVRERLLGGGGRAGVEVDVEGRVVTPVDRPVVRKAERRAAPGGEARLRRQEAAHPGTPDRPQHVGQVDERDLPGAEGDAAGLRVAAGVDVDPLGPEAPVRRPLVVVAHLAGGELGVEDGEPVLAQLADLRAVEEEVGADVAADVEHRGGLGRQVQIETGTPEHFVPPDQDDVALGGEPLVLLVVHGAVAGGLVVAQPDPEPVRQDVLLLLVVGHAFHGAGPTVDPSAAGLVLDGEGEGRGAVGRRRAGVGGFLGRGFRRVWDGFVGFRRVGGGFVDFRRVGGGFVSGRRGFLRVRRGFFDRCRNLFRRLLCRLRLLGRRRGDKRQDQRQPEDRASGVRHPGHRTRAPQERLHVWKMLAIAGPARCAARPVG